MTLKRGQHRKHPPLAFTEQKVRSGGLGSERWIKVTEGDLQDPMASARGKAEDLEPLVAAVRAEAETLYADWPLAA